MSLASIRRWAKRNERKVDGYLARNESYVFFTPIEGNPRGSLNLEVMSAGASPPTRRSSRAARSASSRPSCRPRPAPRAPSAS